MLGLGTFKKVKMMHEKLTLNLLNHGKCRRCPEDFLNKIASNMKRSKILEIHL